MAEKISYRDVFFNPFSKNNPVIVQILGICSVLAVTTKLEPAIVMGLSVIAVLAVCNNLIKDGLTTWLPGILKETYDLPDWTSFLLTMLLPLFRAMIAL